MSRIDPPDFGPVIGQVLATHADRLFLIQAATGETWSYSEFRGLVGRWASWLKTHSLTEGDRCLMVMANSSDFAALYFACLCLGVTAVPVSPALHRSEVAYCLHHARAKMLLHSPVYAAVLPLEEETPGLARIEVDSNVTDAVGQLPNLFANWMPTIPADRLFSVTFTSGSTGVPKGVMHTAHSLLSAALAYNQAFGFRPEHRFYHVLPMTYMAGFLNLLLCPFLAGAAIVLDHPFDARMALDFWREPIRHGVNIAWLVPTMLATLLKIDRNPAGTEYCRENIPHLCIATAPLSLQLKQEFEAKYGTRLHESYGLSEVLFVTANAPSLPFRPGSAGKPLDGVTVTVMDDAGHACQPGIDGEVCVSGPFGMVGYMSATGQPDPTSAPQPFPTGDIGHVDNDGYLHITGRKKDLIVRGGLNISPRTVEEVLHAFPAIAESAVVGLPHDFHGEEVVAAVVWRDGADARQTAAALSFCRSRLSPAAMPARLVAMPELPRSSTGKVLKGRLREMLTEMPA